MYNNVFPIVTKTRCPTEFTKYHAFKEAVTTVKNSFIRADMRSERMTFIQRLAKILKLEEAQGMLFDFAIEQRRAFEKFHDHENIRQIDKLIIKLAQYSTIRVGANTYGDLIINTPLLGLSHNNISAIVHKTVNFAVLALKVGNVRVPHHQNRGILVKAFIFEMYPSKVISFKADDKIQISTNKLTRVICNMRCILFLKSNKMQHVSIYKHGDFLEKGANPVNVPLKIPIFPLFMPFLLFEKGEVGCCCFGDG